MAGDFDGAGQYYTAPAIAFLDDKLHPADVAPTVPATVTTPHYVGADVQIFSNQDFGKIRVIEIDDEVWLVGKDVAAALGYSNPRDALAKHVDDEDKRGGVAIRDSIGREQKPILINESGLYSLVLSSKLPDAKKFKRWVTAIQVRLCPSTVGA